MLQESLRWDGGISAHPPCQGAGVGHVPAWRSMIRRASGGEVDLEGHVQGVRGIHRITRGEGMTRARPRKFAQSFTAKATTTDQDQVLPARGRLFSRYYLPACYQIYRQWHRMGPAGHGWAAAWHPHCLRSLAQINCHPTWSNPDILEDEVWADPKRRVLAGWAERAGLHHPISAFPGPTWGC